MDTDDTPITGDIMDLSAPIFREICYKIQQAKRNPSGEPNSLKEALKTPEKDHQKEATYSEYEQLLRANTFNFISKSQVPRGRKILKNRIVYRLKKDKHNKVYKYKARLVAKGFI